MWGERGESVSVKEVKKARGTVEEFNSIDENEGVMNSELYHGRKSEEVEM